MKKTAAYLCLLLSLFFCMALRPVTGGGDEDAACKILHKGTFLYADENDQPVKVVIKGSKHTEYHNGGKYIIESKLKWLSPCEYNATFVKITVPQFPFKKGTVMNVKVDSVDGGAVICSCTIDGKTFLTKLTKKVK